MTTVRPLRKDAADNRERLLLAAATVFARDGVDAGIEQVAREAGVGMGTVYRHFPTKQALIGELGDVLLADLADLAAAALATPDAAQHGLERYLRTAGALLAERQGYVPVIWQGYGAAPMLDRLRATVGRLLADAQRAGMVGPEVAYTDIAAVLWSLRGVMEATHAAAPDAWMRHLDFVLAGLRTDAISFSIPALDTAQIDAMAPTAPAVPTAPTAQ